MTPPPPPPLFFNKKKDFFQPSVFRNSLWFLKIINTHDNKEIKSVNLNKLLKNLLILIRLIKKIFQQNEKKKIFLQQFKYREKWEAYLKT